jgi:hypothetical protein
LIADPPQGETRTVAAVKNGSASERVLPVVGCAVLADRTGAGTTSTFSMFQPSVVPDSNSQPAQVDPELHASATFAV